MRPHQRRTLALGQPPDRRPNQSKIHERYAPGFGTMKSLAILIWDWSRRGSQ